MDIERICANLRVLPSAEELMEAERALEALEAENEKLRAELEQMAACVYYKQGGLCRYGEEDPANVCVFGPCPHQRSAQEVLAELEQVLYPMWDGFRRKKLQRLEERIEKERQADADEGRTAGDRAAAAGGDGPSIRRPPGEGGSGEAGPVQGESEAGT